MELLDISARELSRYCGLSFSLIARLKKGKRPLTYRSKALTILAKTFLELDDTGRLDNLIGLSQTTEQEKRATLCQFLVGQDHPAMPSRFSPPELQFSGEYLVQQQVFLGVVGFQRTAFLMLDYVLSLPPKQKIFICAHDKFELWHMNPHFAAGFMQKVNEVAQRGTRIFLINQDVPAVIGSPWLSTYWLVAHLRGFLRTFYYKGKVPAEVFVACIPNYWGGVATLDATAEDGLLITLSTDPRFVMSYNEHVNKYLSQSRQGVQYDFLKNPAGLDKPAKCWQPGPLPVVPTQEKEKLNGGFDAINRIPLFGCLTKQHWQLICKGHNAPPIPDYLFRSTESYPTAPHRIILCREDVFAGLTQTKITNEALSNLLGQPIIITQAIFRNLLEDLLMEMRHNKQFQVALVPQSAFQKLEIEFTHWNSSAAVGWLQDMSGSMLACDPAYCVSFATAMDYIWEQLRPGWKRYRQVSTTLRDWLEGENLPTAFEDSAVVQNWQLMPKQ